MKNKKQILINIVIWIAIITISIGLIIGMVFSFKTEKTASAATTSISSDDNLLKVNPQYEGRFWVSNASEITNSLTVLPEGYYTISCDVSATSLDDGYNISDCFIWLNIRSTYYNNYDHQCEVRFDSLNQFKTVSVRFYYDPTATTKVELWGFGNHNGGNHGSMIAKNWVLVSDNGYYWTDEKVTTDSFLYYIFDSFTVADEDLYLYYTKNSYVSYDLSFFWCGKLCDYIYFYVDDEFFNLGVHAWEESDNDFNEVDIILNSDYVDDEISNTFLFSEGLIPKPVFDFFEKNSRRKVTISSYSEGYNDGYNIGYESGNTEGFETGKIIGYGNGYDEGKVDGIKDGLTVGRQEGYDNGYQAGLAEGTSGGYQQGLEEGYNNGYSEGSKNGYDNGYGDGYEEGEGVGYNNGYENGYNKAQSAAVTNPINSFLSPVHKFMNTDFFGSLTYADIFNVVLFISVALIFIKMFGG